MEIEFEAKVTKVTVFPDRAQVTCQGVSEMSLGIHKILFSNLPLVMEQESIRAGGQGAAHIRLLSVDVQRKYYTDAPSSKVQDLEQQIEAVEEQLRVAEDEKAGRLAIGKHLDGLRAASAEYARGLARGKSTVEDQARIIQFFQEQEDSYRADVREIDARLRSLKKEQSKLKNELNEQIAARPKERNQAQIEVEVLEAGEFQAEITYVVNHAGWRPLYDIRYLPKSNQANGGARSLAMTYLAQVTQRTGQDWDAVALTISTARPLLNQQTPELKPWYIDVFRPQPRMMKSAAVRAAPAALAKGEGSLEMASMAYDEPELAAEMAVAEAADNGMAVSYKIGGQSDIPSDGSSHKTTISQFELNPSLDYLAVPKQVDAVFRRIKAVNESAGPLLPGPVNLFVEDDFIGRNQLEFIPVGDEIELIMGVEDRVTIERELVRRDVDKRLLRDTRQMRYGYEIRLQNLLAESITITVQDQFPVSKNEKIKVSLEKIEPKPDEQSQLNLLEWQLSLKPTEKNTLYYEYSIAHPADLNVIGLID